MILLMRLFNWTFTELPLAPVFQKGNMYKIRTLRWSYSKSCGDFRTWVRSACGFCTLELSAYFHVIPVIWLRHFIKPFAVILSETMIFIHWTHCNLMSLRQYHYPWVDSCPLINKSSGLRWLTFDWKGIILWH